MRRTFAARSRRPHTHSPSKFQCHNYARSRCLSGLLPLQISASSSPSPSCPLLSQTTMLQRLAPIPNRDVLVVAPTSSPNSNVARCASSPSKSRLHRTLFPLPKNISSNCKIKMKNTF
ncbi:hypothetical protein L484_011396 [Morus notabilis]|uniref:Uncharacterized protein n=1 Tax=Morus notabilis TaxID=981085 RepID=W9RJT6_9ROSA|nr:hypothetical protein L484_011396 [Morus notabilis]